MVIKKNKKTSAEILGSIEGVEKLIYDKYKLAIGRNNIKKLLEIDGISAEVFFSIMDISYQEKQLSYLKSIESCTDNQGRTGEYASFSHHIWLTNINNPRDIVTYKSSYQLDNQYRNEKIKVEIDDKNNSFIQSIINLDQGSKNANLKLSDGKFHHILWTNCSREDLISHPELSSLRKAAKIDPNTHENFPEFIIININDVMNLPPELVTDIADPEKNLPLEIIKTLQAVKLDLLSLSDNISDMINQKLFASVSDIIRIIAMKNIGGIYFDIDYVLFDQDLVHAAQNKYNLFDIMKNYNCIIGKDSPHDYSFCNAFMASPKAGSKLMNEAWNIIYRNVKHPDEVEYIKYSSSGWVKVLFQTGPVVLTSAFFKSLDEKDIALDFGCLLYCDNPNNPYTPKTTGSIGALGYDMWGGTWVSDTNPSTEYVLYDENDNGITYEQLLAMK